MRALHDRALTSLATMFGVVALLGALLASTLVGPATRVVVYYVVPIELAQGLLSVPIGIALGTEVHRLLLPPPRRCSALRLAAGCSLGMVAGALLAVGSVLLLSRGARGQWLLFALPVSTLLGGWGGGMASYAPTGAGAAARRLPWVRLVVFGLMLLWFLAPHLRAFPAGGTMAERDAWTRRHVRSYGALARAVAALPLVVQDVGAVTGVAPTSSDRHWASMEMNEEPMHFVLDVVGDGGAGTFHADCTADYDRDVILDWQGSTWTFGGKSTRVKE